MKLENLALVLPGLLLALSLAGCEPRLRNDDAGDDDDSGDDDTTDADDDDTVDADDDDTVDADDDDTGSGSGESLQLCDPMPASDPFTLVVASISGDDLELTVSYGGGCEVHEFDLCWDGLVMESFPPQVTLTLIHEDNGDSCLALLTEFLTFDLSPLQPASQGEVVVHVESETVTYTF